MPRSGANTAWPSRDEVLAFAARADAAIVDALEEAELRDDRPAMERAEALYTALEHEAMHQETLLYMWHRLPYEQKRVLPASHTDLARSSSGRITNARVRIPAGVATLGADRNRITFGWDNEFDEHRVDVPAFEIDVHNVTNARVPGVRRSRRLSRFARCGLTSIGTGSRSSKSVTRPSGPRPPVQPPRGSGCGMFDHIPLPPDWPVYVSQAEATAYARWKGRRLPTEAEYHRAAFGTPGGAEQSYPWGEEAPGPEQGNFDFLRFDPVPVGSYPHGASAWGVHDLIGNGWEWTSTVFGPFHGFAPMASYPEYSADFFDGQHYVMKGASPATASELVRRSFRNWFRPNYPYVYAKFRTVKLS